MIREFLTPFNGFILVYSIIFLSSSIRYFKQNQNKSLLFELVFVIATKYIFAIGSLMRMSLPIDFKPITFSSIVEQNSNFLKLIMVVDLLCLIGGIIAYKKGSYKALLAFIFIAVLFQYLGLIL